MTIELTGLHHLTAVTAKASDNHRFYTATLGMRLVKRTVNQDDTSAYHLFYGDGAGSAGSDITFFDWPVAPEQRGTRSIVRTGLRVDGADTVAWWHDRLRAMGVTTGEPAMVDGRMSLDFEDPEGQRLRLVDDGGKGRMVPWAEGPVPADRQIRGLGPVTLSVARIERTDRMLTDVMAMRHERSYEDPARPNHKVEVYAMGPGGPAAELHVVEERDLPAAVQGAGSVHHVAFRTPDRTGLTAWAERTAEMEVRTSGEVERYYFRSLYFREPNGILFEIATDGPGFDADEPIERLGERLSLPPFLEVRRADIEKRLKPL
ncbi:MAG: ring-cleaving dioxygenase [Hyphomicrobiaceae bacterium]